MFWANGAWQSTGLSRVTEFEGEHIPLKEIMLVLGCLIHIISPQYLFYP